MKRSGFLQRNTPLRQKGSSETTDIKERIQALVRRIVIARDGDCIFGQNVTRQYLAGNGIPQCNGYNKFHELILQADHLITRANSATYADTRLIVCVCKGHHGWKKWNEARYNEIVRSLISKERVELWDKAHAARYQPHRKYTYDWRIEEAALKQELATYETSHRS